MRCGGTKVCVVVCGGKEKKLSGREEGVCFPATRGAHVRASATTAGYSGDKVTLGLGCRSEVRLFAGAGLTKKTSEDKAKSRELCNLNHENGKKHSILSISTTFILF